MDSYALGQIYQKYKDRYKDKLVVVGVLGAIGSGKTTITKILSEFGARVIIADDIAKNVLRKQTIREKIFRAFGNCFLPNGEIDRKKLAKMVFANREKLKVLEQILNPDVFEEVARKLNKIFFNVNFIAKKIILVLDAPLLVENGHDKYCDFLFYVDAPLYIRWERVKNRIASLSDLKKRESYQTPEIVKKKLAHFVIDNSRKRALVRRELKNIYNLLCN